MDNIDILIPLLFIGAFILTCYLVPKIRGVVNYKRLSEEPNERSSHTRAVPSLGGIAFYMILMVSVWFVHPYDTYNEIASIIPGLTVLFMAGLKDDLVVLGAWTKLAAQILAAAFVVFHYKFSIVSLYGFMGIESMPVWLAAAFAIFIIIAVINAFNLIDGIDGLASGLGILIFAGFSVIFFLTGNITLMLMAILLTGSLLGFLVFNLSKKHKIFMGDTGSMIIGFMAGLMAVRVLAFQPSTLNALPFQPENIPFVILGLLFVPLFDTGRVFMVRILEGKSPFKADRKHTHHIIMDFFDISHRRTSFFMGIANLIIAFCFAGLSMIFNQWAMLAVFTGTVLSLLLAFYILQRTNLNQTQHADSSRLGTSISAFRNKE